MIGHKQGTRIVKDESGVNAARRAGAVVGTEKKGALHSLIA